MKNELLDTIPGEKAAKERFQSSVMKGCPFCGSQPYAGVLDPGAPYPGGYYYVGCENEECPVGVGIECNEKAHACDAEEAIGRVIERWNTRV